MKVYDVFFLLIRFLKNTQIVCALSMNTILILLCFISITSQASLNVETGKYLTVDGQNFVYNGERVTIFTIGIYCM